MAGWTFSMMKSLQLVDIVIFAKITIDMLKKMLFLRFLGCGLQWPERSETVV